MKISIITVSYNSEKTIETTLASVAAQNFPCHQYIIIDGASTDSTIDIVHSYPDLVTECISEPDQGIYDAMNKGVFLATGDIVGILNSDDFYLNDHVLDDVATFFSTDSELDVLLGDVDFVNDDDLLRPVRRYSTGNFRPWMFRFGLMPPHPAVFIRKSAYERVGLYKQGYKIAADFDFLIRLLLIDGAKYKITHKTLVRMRTGGTSTSGLKSVITITQEMKRSLRENNTYTNLLMLLCRLPYKLVTHVLRKSEVL